jgi:hypothetical protein
MLHARLAMRTESSATRSEIATEPGTVPVGRVQVSNPVAPNRAPVLGQPAVTGRNVFESFAQWRQEHEPTGSCGQNKNRGETP